VRQGADKDLMKRMRFVYWIKNSTNTHSEY